MQIPKFADPTSLLDAVYRKTSTNIRWRAVLVKRIAIEETKLLCLRNVPRTQTKADTTIFYLAMLSYIVTSTNYIYTKTFLSKKPEVETETNCAVRYRRVMAQL